MHGSKDRTLAVWKTFWYADFMSKVRKKEAVVAVPAKYAGKWVAWSENQTRVVASGRAIREVSQQIRKRGEKNVWFDKIPDANIRFGGAAFHV